jgi:hypothetical protein
VFIRESVRAIISPVKVPNGYCPNHATGIRLPDDFAIPATPLQYVD